MPTLTGVATPNFDNDKTTAFVRILAVTNDYPPKPGGIQQYLGNTVAALDAEVRILGPAEEGADGDGVVDGEEDARAARFAEALKLLEQRPEGIDLVDLGAWNNDPLVIQAIKEKIDEVMPSVVEVATE